MPVGRKPFQTTDGHRLALAPAHTMRFALGLLRTYTTANSGQRAGFRDGQIGTLGIARHQLLDEIRNLDIDRAAGHAGARLTIQAALRFLHRHIPCVTFGYFFKIGRTNSRFLFRHRRFRRLFIDCHTLSPLTFDSF